MWNCIYSVKNNIIQSNQLLHVFKIHYTTQFTLKHDVFKAIVFIRTMSEVIPKRPTANAKATIFIFLRPRGCPILTENSSIVEFLHTERTLTDFSFVTIKFLSYESKRMKIFLVCPIPSLTNTNYIGDGTN